MAAAGAHRIDLKRWVEQQRTLRDRFLPAAMRGVLEGAHRGRVLMLERTRSAPPANPAGVGTGGAVNTGDFLRRWKAESTKRGARIFNVHPAAGVIEHGRRPGKHVPIQPLIEWARRRLGLDEKEARAAAFAISASIKARGLIGRKILTAPEAEAEIERMAIEEIDRALMAELTR